MREPRDCIGLNEEKAKEIASKYERWNQEDDESFGAYNGAMEMAEWKDQQFAEEKKQWFEKAQHVLGNILVSGVHPQGIQGFIKQFQQAMEK